MLASNVTLKNGDGQDISDNVRRGTNLLIPRVHQTFLLLSHVHEKPAAHPAQPPLTQSILSKVSELKIENDCLGATALDALVQGPTQ